MSIAVLGKVTAPEAEAGEHVGICECGWVSNPEDIGTSCPFCGTPYLAPLEQNGMITIPAEAFRNLEAEWLRCGRMQSEAVRALGLK